MTFYTTMKNASGENKAYIYRNKKELETVIRDGMLTRAGYSEIKNYKTDKGIRLLCAELGEKGIQYARTYKSTDYVYREYDFCVPAIGKEFMFKAMFF